jgi:hypothetical protein
VGDFNGDGNVDLAIPHSRSHTVSILLGDGNGGFGVPLDNRAGREAFNVAVGDFNKDGALDLAMGTILQIRILLGAGTGGFHGEYSYHFAAAPKSARES